MSAEAGVTVSRAGEGHRLFGMAAEFKTAADIYHAAEKVRDAGFQRWDVHTPFPVHGMDEAMGLGPSRLSLFSLIGGCTGLLTALALTFFTSAQYSVPTWLPQFFKQAYPLIVHGKPFFALEPLVPIFFELCILLTAFGTVIGLLVLNLLPRWHHPMFGWHRFHRATDDAFFLVIESADPRFSEEETPMLLASLGGQHITSIYDEE